MKKLIVVVGVILLTILTSGLIDNKHKQHVDAAVSSLGKDVPKHTNCALCNMIVYQKKQKMGVFSAQAIKKNGKVVYYDDIGCLLYDEVRNKTKNKKYVRDYKTLKWTKVEKVTYVKTNLSSPMGWGYLYFAKKSEAKKYIAKNKKCKIVKLSKIKSEATKRYKNQFKKTATTVPSSNETTLSDNTVASSLKKDVPNNTDCAFCNMVVYQQNVSLGVFAAQAIKQSGKVVYYDDISCLLYDEVKQGEMNKKYVRDYKTLNWIQAENATYVKTLLTSPMDDGYIYFALVADANKYIAEHPGTKVVPFQTVKKECIQNYQ